MSSYTSIHLAERPTDQIIPGKTFKSKKQPIPNASSLKDGEVLIQTLYLSLDPAMRGWLRDARSYVPPVQIDEKMRGYGIGIVKASKSSKFPVGSYAAGGTGWAEYAVLNEKHLEAFDLPEGAVPTDMLGVMGMTGLTAYFGILDIGAVKKGDFVVVSGAAGATGSVVGQIAKIKGATVLGLAGGDEKVKWLKEELGFDDALNYKDPDFKNKFRAATKGLIDVFFDNVGGDILDMALARAKPHARFVMCGAISQYNTAKPQGPKNYMMIISMRIRMQGFIVMDYASQYGEAKKQLAQWLSEGKLKRKETVLKGGLSKAEQGLVDLYNGVNTGKLMVEVASPEDAKAKL
ncbi:NAD(P)-binding protein [Amniculicola lignicola CBS 123094]|uniref:NAD(P)-binding protein n=1 Tax=Amniculicola lignicola CBS 123094 TaxID=1392246 RepID=A0A6A5WCL6_9PLEO|nr:NAD(P)-binding protein [Amniculicola lignicola CBS 123094]